MDPENNSDDEPVDLGPNPRICCKCGRNDVWRLELRECEHMLCIACGIVYLRWSIQDLSKARIKCPKSRCVQRFHENDISALLDRDNRSLDPFMPKEHREWLTYKHDSDVILYGLGGKELARQCPICLNIYAPEAGCHYVRCPNTRCNTWFCWQCKQPAKSWQHFTRSCRVSGDDLFKLSYFARFLIFTEGLLLIFISPVLAFVAFAGIPFMVSCGIPYLVLSRWHKQLYEFGPLILFASICISPFSIFVAMPMFALYLAAAIAKQIPQVREAINMIEMSGMILQMIGFGDWKEFLKDTQNARYELEVEKAQAEQEKSERMEVGEMTAEQASRKKAMDQATKARLDKGYKIKVKPQMPF
ncbi:hypothetical protein QR680_017807 [Steinernema hermaphroditum]|uniref:Uncharacterized protein n=1 Tax=Steinernema hermaphroditum TaxID=289476 RepID=A0AA39LQ22_9BILA|nr:hypothetical protein QR680_017807 [Steinernema hermaphroditum]